MSSESPRFSREAPDKLTALATSVHGLVEQMLRTDEGDAGLDEDLDWAIRAADEIRSRLARHGRGEQVRFGDDDAEGGRPYYVRGALVGPHHPMSMPVEIETDAGVTRGRVRLDLVWEGPPGHVHGGYVAYLYDCIMGHHNIAVGVPGMTGTLSVRFRRPTPLYRDLDFQVRTTRTSGRKIVVEAQVCLEGDVLSEAEGLFIVPRDFAAHVRSSGSPPARER